MKKIYCLKAVTAALILCASHTVFSQQVISIIPQPQKLTLLQGAFILSEGTSIVANTDSTFTIALRELNQIKKSRERSKISNKISFVRDKALKPEAYRLHVDDKTIVVYANDKLGAFWAVSTLKQLAGESVFKPIKPLTIQAADISDAPKFAWRGVHLDVSRHFFDMDYLHKFIDRMAQYKFNKFHWHLTDDQGWRIEIKKYPELTEVGAWRKMNNQDSMCLKKAETNPDFNLPEKHFKTINGEKMYGGFYTQQEVKAFIRYAQTKGIEIIPEIDMPGHMQAATKQFPWLTSTGEIQQGKNFTDPICPCKETTFEFAENVFKEIADLFPSKYIHLGADEVEKSSWKNIPACEELMKREGLKSIDEIQSYFVKRMEKYFNSIGKKLIGWDEILDGGVSPTATMMYWRTWIPDAPKHAAEKHNDLIMTPGEFCYFDAQQDAHSLKKVYGFDPVGFNLSKEEQKYVLGGQANIWTESIPSEQRLEYMLFPRLFSMAEVLWGTKTDFSNFQQRVNKQYASLDAQKINYRFPDLSGFTENNVFVNQTELKIQNPLQGTLIRYTTDGSNPTIQSAVYSGALPILKSQQIKAAVFSKENKHGDVYTINYKKTPYLAAVEIKAPKKGLDFSYYPKAYTKVALINEAERTFKGSTSAIEIPVKDTAPSFATKHTGYFYAPEDAIYSFYLRSDDGSVLKMHNEILVDNDGMHFAIEKSAQIALKKGYHPFELLFLEGGGGYTLELNYSVNTGERKVVGPENFFR